jgi:MFS family permease
MTALVPVMIVPGSIVGGVTADRWGRKKSIFLFLGINVIFTILLIFASTWWLVVCIYGTVLFMGGASASAHSAMYMDVTNPKVGATQFSLFSGLGGVGDVGGRMVAGFFIVALGFHYLFIIAGLLLLPPLLLLRLIKYNK